MDTKKIKEFFKNILKKDLEQDLNKNINPITKEKIKTKNEK